MNMKAIKTEYKGVVFDSKSEAIMARTFDIAGVEWEYHPPKCFPDWHEWDFWVSATKSYFGFVGLIEYKPSMPTMTYVKNLTDKMRPSPSSSLVVWGSKWNPSFASRVICSSNDYLAAYPVFCCEGKYGWGDFCPMSDCACDAPFSNRHRIEDTLGIFGWEYELATLYRFDLHHKKGQYLG